MQRRARILLVCPSEWERTATASPELQRQYEFIPCCEELYEPLGLWRALSFDAERYLQRVIAEQRGNGIDGILAPGDYPGCIFGAYIAEHLGLKGPGTRETLLLSHKLHSRRIQRRFAPAATPDFAALEPLVLPWSLREPSGLAYPFFVKPVKGTMSIRARMVHNRSDLYQALRFTPREWVDMHLLFLPCAQLLRRYEPSPVSPYSFIAEAPLRGQQITVDGFVQSGRATVMGIVDSIMYPGTMSFRRFEYPSTLPQAVQERMSEIAVRVMEGSGFDHSCFNMEMFYDAQRDQISIIEINPRMSYQFSDLFAHVDGMSSFAVQLQLALGKQVHWPRRHGRFAVAASFVMRRFADAFVVSVPDQAQIDEVEQRYPETQLNILCAPGERLSDRDQDVGSYRYCIVNMAALSHDELCANYSAVEESLPFSFR